MSDAKQKAKTLLDIAIATYMEEIQPTLPEDKRYVGAMVGNALAAAERRLAHGDPDLALLQTLGANDMESLANSIRSGKVSDTTHKNLKDALMAYTEAELAITNPKFLKRRTG